jgi:hypothetical protein
VKGPTVGAIFHYVCFTLALKSFLNQPGDGRIHPQIPAACLSWALLISAMLRVSSASRLEWLVRAVGPKGFGLASGFGDDALAYFTERADPEVIRRRTAATLKLAKCNKAFQETAFIGLAIDGTGAGRTTKAPCSLCHPVKDPKGAVTCHLHHFVMVSVVGAGITLPFDVEPYQPGDSESSAGKRLLKRAVNHLGGRFADYVVVDAKFATAPFLHLTDGLKLPTVARVKENLPELAAAVEARFGRQSPKESFQYGEDWVEAWDADDFDPWSTLNWPTVRVLRYRQHKKDGTVIQAEWLTDFSIARLGTRSFFKLAKSRWEIENQGFNDAKNLYGAEHIQHHHPNSMLINWLFLLLALIVERLYRTRYLHRGTHPILSSMQLKDTLWLNLRAAGTDTS